VAEKKKKKGAGDGRVPEDGVEKKHLKKKGKQGGGRKRWLEIEQKGGQKRSERISGRGKKMNKQYLAIAGIPWEGVWKRKRTTVPLRLEEK